MHPVRVFTRRHLGQIILKVRKLSPSKTVYRIRVPVLVGQCFYISLASCQSESSFCSEAYRDMSHSKTTNCFFISGTSFSTARFNFFCRRFAFWKSSSRTFSHSVNSFEVMIKLSIIHFKGRHSTATPTAIITKPGVVNPFTAVCTFSLAGRPRRSQSCSSSLSS